MLGLCSASFGRYLQKKSVVSFLKRLNKNLKEGVVLCVIHLFVRFAEEHLLNQNSPIVGVWRGKSNKSENSETTLRFCENGQFFIDFSDSFYIVTEGGKKKLYFASNQGIIKFQAQKYCGTRAVKGFRCFVKCE